MLCYLKLDRFLCLFAVSSTLPPLYLLIQVLRGWDYSMGGGRQILMGEDFQLTIHSWPQTFQAISDSNKTPEMH